MSATDKLKWSDVPADEHDEETNEPTVSEPTVTEPTSAAASTAAASAAVVESTEMVQIPRAEYLAKMALVDSVLAQHKQQQSQKVVSQEVGQSAAAAVCSVDPGLVVKKEEKICRYFANYGECRAGSLCRFEHMKPCRRSFDKCDKRCNRPEWQHMAVCENFKYGYCRFGRQCNRLHLKKHQTNKARRPQRQHANY